MATHTECRVLALFILLTLATPTLADVVMWRAPDKRENGELLKPEEIGGYELRALDAEGQQIWHKPIPDPSARSSPVPLVLNAAVFQISAYDTDGLYSEWVVITPRPAPPGQGWLE